MKSVLKIQLQRSFICCCFASAFISADIIFYNFLELYPTLLKNKSFLPQLTPTKIQTSKTSPNLTFKICFLLGVPVLMSIARRKTTVQPWSLGGAGKPSPWGPSWGKAPMENVWLFSILTSSKHCSCGSQHCGTSA